MILKGANCTVNTVFSKLPAASREMFATSTNSSLGQSSNSQLGSQHNKSGTNLFAAPPQTSSPFTSITSSVCGCSVPAYEQSSTPAFGSLSGCVVQPHVSYSPHMFHSDRTIQAAILLPLSHLASQPCKCVAHHQVLPSLEGAPQLVYLVPAAQTTTPFTSNTDFGAFNSSVPAFGYGGSQTPTPAFGNPGIRQTGFQAQRGGSRVANYTPTMEPDSGTSGQTVKLESISAMPLYKQKSHEELRWEDNQLGDKGGPLSSAQPTGLSGFNSSTTVTNTFGSSPGFGQSSANPFSSTSPSNSNPFAPKSLAFPSSGFGTSTPSFSSSGFGSSTSATTASIFNSPSPSPFGANTCTSPNFVAPTTSQPLSGFIQQTPSPFGQATSFNQYSLFNSPSSGVPLPIAQSSGTGCSNPSAHSSSLFAIAQKSSPLPSSAHCFRPSGNCSFGQSSSAFGSAFGMSAALGFGNPGGFGSSRNPMFGSTSNSAFGTSSSPFGASSTPAFGTLPSITLGFSFGSSQAFGQSSSAFGGSSLFGSTTSAFGGQSSAFGSQTPTPAFGNPGIGQKGFGAQRGGSRVANYTPTTEPDSGTSDQTAKLVPPALGSSQPFGSNLFGNTQSSQLFSSTPATTSQPLSGFGQQTPSPSGQMTSLNQSSLFNSPSSGFGGNLFSTSAPLASSSLAGFGQTVPPSISSASEPAQPDPSRNSFDSSTFGQIEPSPWIKVKPIFDDKSPEELRWEDHQSGDKASVGVAAKLRSLFKKANTEELNSMLRILSENKPEVSQKQIMQLLNEIQKLVISV